MSEGEGNRAVVKTTETSNGTTVAVVVPIESQRVADSSQSPATRKAGGIQDIDNTTSIKLIPLTHDRSLRHRHRRVVC